MVTGMPAFRTPAKGEARSREMPGWGVAGGGVEEDMSKVWEMTKEEREICRRCKIRVNSGEMGLICDFCNRWFHSTCEKLSKKEYEMIMKMDQKVRWYCSGCEGAMEGMQNVMMRQKEEIVELNKTNKELFKAVRELEKRTAGVEEKCRKMTEETNRILEHGIGEKLQRAAREATKVYEEKTAEYGREVEELKVITTTMEKRGGIEKEVMRKELEGMKKEIVHRGMEEINKKKVEDEKMMEEMQTKLEDIERERRSKNIVVFNLIESEEEEARKRYEEDEELCKNLIKEELGLKEVTIGKVIRLGRKIEGKTRPLLVKLDSGDSRILVLQNARRLRHSVRFQRVYINKDLTVAERNEDKKLREELKEKRSADGEERFIIRRGKVIRINEERRNEPIRKDERVEKPEERRDGGIHQMTRGDDYELGARPKERRDGGIHMRTGREDSDSGAKPKEKRGPENFWMTRGGRGRR